MSQDTIPAVCHDCGQPFPGLLVAPDLRPLCRDCQPTYCAECGVSHNPTCEEMRAIAIDALQPFYDRAYERDRWQEALLGARLRFHADPSGNANEPPAYWVRIYERWQELYHAGLKGDIAPGRLESRPPTFGPDGRHFSPEYIAYMGGPIVGKP